MRKPRGFASATCLTAVLAAWLLIAPLTLDTFAISAALGLQRLARRDRWRLTLLFTAFEGGMPLVGALGGGLVGELAKPFVGWMAIAILAAAGLYMLLRHDEDEERLGRLARSHGPLQLALGLSISLDEVAIGFTLGLLQLPLWIVCPAIAVQAAVVTQIGLHLGARVGERVREFAERLAGVVLVGLAVAFTVLTLTRPSLVA